MAPRPSLFERSAAWFGVAGFAASFFLFAPAAICAEDKNGWPSAEDILKKTIERVKWSEEHKLEAKYTYTQRGTFEELDSRDNVKKHEDRVSQVLPIEGEPYARLMLKDGKPLSDKEERIEQERERKFREGLAERRRKRAQGKKEDTELELNEELVSKYQFDLTGRELVNGRPAFVLSFQPRSADLPVNRRLDRLLNKLAGKVWIDEKDYEICRVDLHLAENVSAWGGMLASVRKFLFRLEQTKLDGAVWLPSFVDGYIDGRILIRSLHMRLKQQNSDFRRIETQVGLANTSKR